MNARPRFHAIRSTCVFDLDQARARRRDAARTEARQAVQSCRRQCGDEIEANAVPGRNEHRGEAVAEAAQQRGATRGELVDARCNRALAAKLRGALAVRLVVRVRIAVLDDRCLMRSARLRRRGSHPLSPGSRRPQPERRCGVRCRAAVCSAGESLQASSSRHQSVARRPAARHASSSRSSASQPVASAPHSCGFAAMLPRRGRNSRLEAALRRSCERFRGRPGREQLGKQNGGARGAIAVEVQTAEARPRSRVVHGASERFRRQRSIVDDDAQDRIRAAARHARAARFRRCR